MKAKRIYAILLVFSLALYLGCKDDSEAPLSSQNESSLSSGQYSEKYTVEEAVEIFKSGDQEAINKVVMSRKRVIWDGKSEFENGVQYRITEDQFEKAREINEDFRRANDIDRAWQPGGPSLSAKEVEEANELMKEFKFYVQCDDEEQKEAELELYQGGKMETGKAYFITPKMRKTAVQENPEWAKLDSMSAPDLETLKARARAGQSGKKNEVKP